MITISGIIKENLKKQKNLIVIDRKDAERHTRQTPNKHI